MGELIFIILVYAIFGMSGIWVLLGLFCAVMSLVVFGVVMDDIEKGKK